jgi:hypothetical protein
VKIKKENALRQKKILKIATHKISSTPIIENIASDWENIFRRKPFSFYWNLPILCYAVAILCHLAIFLAVRHFPLLFIFRFMNTELTE